MSYNTDKIANIVNVHPRNSENNVLKVIVKSLNCINNNRHMFFFIFDLIQLSTNECSETSTIG